MSVRRKPPRGRDEVRDALLDAATALYQRRGPARVSVRDVASRAGVNHGLVHRHFGSKDALTAEVMARLVARLQADLWPEGQPIALAEALRLVFAATRKHTAYWQILARALLDGDDPRALQGSFPVVQRLVDVLAASGRAGKQARGWTAVLVAGGLGLLVFAPFVRAATGLDAKTFNAFVDGLPEKLAG